MDRKDGGAVYEVYWVKSEAVALEYLRRRDVREEQYYVIVETPERNLGRDMVMIFDEADGAMLEIPSRTPLPELRASATHCSRCGYPILPCTLVGPGCTDPDCGHAMHVNDFAQSTFEVIVGGFGYRCISCDSAACRACYEATGEKVSSTAAFRPAANPDLPHPGGDVRVFLCWACDSPVTAFSE
ncbi:MAG: hypothetical protein GEV11_01805 [Streptosporangiales bacterium]|nr:hypothetical protein [Streptosporangiales bacterium]